MSLPALVRPVETGPAVVQHDVGVARLLVALHHHHVCHTPAHPSNNNKERRPQRSCCCRWNWLYPCPPFLAKNGKASTFHQREKILESRDRMKIRLIEVKAKCCHLKKLTCKGTLRQVFICLRPRSPYILNPLTDCMRVHRILIHTWKGERGGQRVDPERGLEGKQFTKLGRKYQHDWLYLQSINSDNHWP